METRKINAPGMDFTLSEAVNQAIGQGFTERLVFALIGLTTDAEEKYYSPRDVRIVKVFRFERSLGAQDQAILYLMETSDRKKGILIDNEGEYSEGTISAFIRDVRNSSAEVIKINY